MKQVRIIFIVTFFAILGVPIVLFNHEKNAVSKIDNKVLTENPFGADAEPVDDLTDALESFVSERIGLRDQMILSYIVANDRLFGEMVHPNYMYGEDGHVFFKAGAVKTYGEFEDAYVNMLCEIQKYCDDRNISFVFVYQPSKTDVLRDKLPKGYIYNNDWTDTFFQKLDENGVNYVDNSVPMEQCMEDGIEVFNVKYDAGHWNDTGAFYGMNYILSNLNQFDPSVHINDIEEFVISQKLETTLLGSQFPIHEYVPDFSIVDSDGITTVGAAYVDEIEMDSNFRYFEYTINRKRGAEGSPKALVFQGSYINEKGYKYFANSFSEYVGVHAYQNVINFDYYVNIFRPECIVFDAAEFTFSNNYFDQGGMSNFKLNKLLSSFDDYETLELDGRVVAEQGRVLTQIRLYDVVDCDYAYAVIDDQEFDMKKCMDGDTGEIYYKLSVVNDNYNTDNISFALIDEASRTKYILN